MIIVRMKFPLVNGTPSGFSGVTRFGCGWFSSSRT
jgi:hypothetical protein